MLLRVNVDIYIFQDLIIMFKISILYLSLTILLINSLFAFTDFTPPKKFVVVLDADMEGMIQEIEVVGILRKILP